MPVLHHEEAHAQHNKTGWKWSLLPAVPDLFGFAGAFAGQIDGGLLLLGGANFPDGIMPWDGGAKRWSDRVFFLGDNGSEWQECGTLPVRLGYGASASFGNTLLLAGGSNESGHYDKVYSISRNSDSLQITTLPSLPMPLANMSGILIGKIWYIVGGLAKPDMAHAENACFSLDVARPEDGWKVCPPLPGEGRMLAVLGTDGISLYVFSGVALRDGQRHYLKDAYCYRPGATWMRLEDLPYAAAAAPSPCSYDPIAKQFFIFGGDDGELARQQLGMAHPGFSHTILTFDVKERKWNDEQIMLLPDDSLPPVTTTAIVTGNSVVLPMGEVKPGIRTAKVLLGNRALHQKETP